MLSLAPVALATVNADRAIATASIRPAFRTIPPLDARLRAQRIDEAVRLAFALKPKFASAATCCSVCTFPIGGRERIARMPAGTIRHAGCCT